MCCHGLNCRLANIGGFCLQWSSRNHQLESQNSDASVYLKLWYCTYIHVEYHRLHENNFVRKRQLKCEAHCMIFEGDYCCVCVLIWALAREGFFAILGAFEPHCMDPPHLAS